MPAIEHEAPLRLLRTGYAADDWVAIFLKSYATGRICQRVAPIAVVTRPRFLAWLRWKNRQRWNVYVSVNAVTPRRRSRARDAVVAIRHVFLEADADGSRVLATVARRGDLPVPSYLLPSSPGRVHVFWRVCEFRPDDVEQLQKALARELRTDLAATSCSQTTRLPGFLYLNHKYSPAPLVTMVYGRVNRVYTPRDFPAIVRAPQAPSRRAAPTASTETSLVRAERYLAAVPPAVSGQHGDLHTFQVCCRMVRGFALSDGDALTALAAWNARCAPPWRERELLDKLARARRLWARADRRAALARSEEQAHACMVMMGCRPIDIDMQSNRLYGSTHPVQCACALRAVRHIPCSSASL